MFMIITTIRDVDDFRFVLMISAQIRHAPSAFSTTPTPKFHSSSLRLALVRGQVSPVLLAHATIALWADAPRLATI